MSRHKQSEIDLLAGLMGNDQPVTQESSEIDLICEEGKSSIGYSNEPGENEVWTHKAHGNRHLVMKGTKVGGMLGHVDMVPHVNLTDMSNDPSKDGHHAYGVKYRKGKGGILHAVTHRLGEFNTHDAAVAAVKKFHKID